MDLYDLHTHSTHSDGELLPSESARTAFVKGYAGIAVTDHADSSNIIYLLESNLRFKETFNRSSDNFKVIVGVEITHVNPDDIGILTKTARDNGADIVIVHGETISEPVAAGTNRAAIEAGVDILAHPGLISYEDAALAAEKQVYLEITTRKSHAYTNAHVASMAGKTGAKLVINNDAHSPSDFVGVDKAIKIMMGAGLSDNEINDIADNNKRVFEKAYGGQK
ncbi:MAG: histidinol phosphate phosphatase domain-containing protein [Mucispirillum sp.]|nr:histidinol phosphate phosphatase domain-containing protein [Mucispirillum sp.]